MEANPKIEPMQSTETTKSAKGRSTIEFPYLDLENALGITTAIYEIGGSSCTWDQLAGYLKQASQGGGFRLRMICAKQFGLVTYDRGTVTLTALGLRAVDPQQQRSAKVDAFLNIPLYKAVHNKFKGSSLPPQAGLEREMINLGVSAKQADKARQVFARSAKLAGFFEFGADRLVAPANVGQAPGAGPTLDRIEEGPSNKTRGGGDDGGSGYHPFIDGLLKTLPTEESEWPIAGRIKWLQAAANIFDLLYKTGEVDETARIEIKKDSLI